MNVDDKSKAILEQGRAERGQFDPEPGAAHLKMYQYWLNVARDGYPVPNENFCHYWRVVLFWGPLFWLTMHTIVPLFKTRPMRAVGNGLSKVFTGKSGDRILMFSAALWSLAVLFLLVLAAAQNWLILVAIVAGVVFFAAIIVGTSFVMNKFEEKSDERARRNISTGDYDEIAEVEPRRPSAFKRFMSGVWSYVRLVANVVRTKKWKICPLVKVPAVDKAGTV